MSRRKWILISAVAAAAAAIGGGLYWWRDYPVHHFGVVRYGVLYRSGQPDEMELKRLKRRFGIRTIVNLRAVERNMERQDWYRQEADFCRRDEIALIDVPMDSSPNTLAELRRVFEIVGDHGRQPVLVHCEAGSARTGFVAAAFRIVMDGWTYERAMAEADSFHFNPERESRQEYDRILRELANRKLKLTTAPLSPSPGGLAGSSTRPH